MKIGVRKPSIKKSVRARTTGKAKRKMKAAVNPVYGKKGTGIVNDPKKAIYDKVYNKVTVDLRPESGKTKAEKRTGSGFLLGTAIALVLLFSFVSFISNNISLIMALAMAGSLFASIGCLLLMLRPGANRNKLSKAFLGMYATFGSIWLSESSNAGLFGMTSMLVSMGFAVWFTLTFIDNKYLSETKDRKSFRLLILVGMTAAMLVANGLLLSTPDLLQEAWSGIETFMNTVFSAVRNIFW